MGTDPTARAPDHFSGLHGIDSLAIELKWNVLLSSSARPAHRALSLPSTSLVASRRPPSGLRAHYPYRSLRSGPSHCSSHKLWQPPPQPQWGAHDFERGRSGLSTHLYSNYVRGLSLAASLEILRVLRPAFYLRAIRFTCTTKKSHAYIIVIDGFIISDHEDPVVLPVSILIIISIKSLRARHKNLESVSW
ncbi:hypothetical protein Dimus_036847 [Dionaea muscipula]